MDLTIDKLRFKFMKLILKVNMGHTNLQVIFGSLKNCFQRPVAPRLDRAIHRKVIFHSETHIQTSYAINTIK